MIGQLRDEEEWQAPGPMPIESLDNDDEEAPRPHDDAVVAADDPDAVVEDAARRTPLDPAASRPNALQDYYERKGLFTVRMHVVHRIQMFTPLEVPDEPPPVDIKHIDVMRSTRTDLHEFPSLLRIDDCWTGHDGDKKNVHIGPGGIPTPWTGET